MATPPIDYDALAKKFGATTSKTSGAVDYDSLAAKFGAANSKPVTPVPDLAANPSLTNFGASQAQKLGVQAQPITQFEQERDPNNQKGLFETGWEGLKSFLQLPGAQNPYPGMGTDQKQQAFQQAQQQGQQEKQAGYGAAYRAATIPFAAIGGNTAAVEHEADIGNAQGVLGYSAAPGVAAYALAKAAPKAAQVADAATIVDAPTALTAAAKGNAKFLQAAQAVEPELAAIRAKSGIPPTISDAASAVKQHSLALESEYQGLLKPKAEVPVSGSGDRIATAIESNITQAMLNRSPGLAERIQTLADSYKGRDIPAGELEQLRKDLSGTQDSTLAQTGLKKSQAMRDPNIRYQLNELEAIKSELYNALGARAKEIKLTQSNLQTIQGQLEKRNSQLVPQEAIRKSTPISSTVGNVAQEVLNLKAGRAAKVVLDRMRAANSQPNAQVMRAFKHFEP